MNHPKATKILSVIALIGWFACVILGDIPFLISIVTSFCIGWTVADSLYKPNIY